MFIKKDLQGIREKKKVFLIRLDKIGDLICTLPVDLLFDPNQFDVIWVIQKGLGAVVNLDEQKRSYVELDKENPATSTKTLDKLLQKEKPDAAISFQAPWWVNFSLWKNRVPIRSGVLSQWHSFVFLNRGLRQKRSRAEKHEFDYNKDLVLSTFKLHEPRIQCLFHMAPPAELDTTKLLESLTLASKSYQVVHPGMMGSALNWPEENYIAYIDSQLAKGEVIAITGTALDEPYLQKIKTQFENHPQVRWLQSKLNLKELVTVLSQAKKVVAPSTGVAHLSASLGIETHVIFSPVRVHHATRWAPRGRNVVIYLPKLEKPCPGTLKCLKQACPQYDCMRTISLE